MPLIFAELDTPLSFTRFEAGKLDTKKPGYYPGVLVIEKGPAKGHFAVKDGSKVVNYDPTKADHAKLDRYQIMIGDETLDDVVSCGAETDSTKCKLDHGSTVRDIVGDYNTFRRSGDQVRADLTLMDSTPHRGYVMELFAKFAKKIGNSVDFDYSYEIKGDVVIARCRKLNSVDIVDAPAATKSLFSQNLTTQIHMPLDANDLKAIGDLVDTKLTAVKTEFTTKFTDLSKKLEEGDEDKDKKDADKKDEDKEAEMSKKMSEVASKAALAAVDAVFPKAQREQFSKIATDPGKSKFEQLVDVQLSAGAPNRGVAIIRAARDHAVEYNIWMAAQNSGNTKL